MLSPEILNLIIQLPIVGLFVWYTLQSQKQNAEANATRDAEWRKFLQEQQDRYNETLSEIVEKNNASLTEVAGQLSALSEQISRLTRSPLLKKDKPAAQP